MVNLYYIVYYNVFIIINYQEQYEKKIIAFDTTEDPCKHRYISIQIPLWHSIYAVTSVIKLAKIN
jgi:hypothetical protein